MRRVVVALAVAVLMSACGGPKVPLQIVGKAVPVDVKFGNPLPPATVRPVPGGYIIVPQPIPPDPLGPIFFPPIKPPKPLPCPKAGPLEFPAEAATTDILEAPKAAKYQFRTTRSLGSTKPGAPFIELREVGNPQSSTDPATGRQAFRYDVSTSNPFEATITSYLADETQLAITGIQWFRGGVLKEFAPVTPLKIMPIPPEQTLALGNALTTWQSAASDPRSQIAVSLEGKTNGRQRIDACGKIIDTWRADLQLHWVSPTADFTETWRINVATQYGGLIVSEASTRKGTRDGASLDETWAATITRVPE